MFFRKKVKKNLVLKRLMARSLDDLNEKLEKRQIDPSVIIQINKMGPNLAIYYVGEEE